MVAVEVDADIKEEEEEEEEEEEATSEAEGDSKVAEVGEEDRIQVHSPCIRTWERFRPFCNLSRMVPVQISWMYVQT